MHPRAYAVLVDNGVDFVEHLLLYNVNDLMQLPGMGKGMASLVQEALTKAKLSLSPYLHPRERHRKAFEEKYAASHPEWFSVS